jgi:copper chaperone CopZ
MMARYRPLMLVATAASLGFGFYLSYRKPKPVAGEGCECTPGRTRRVSRITLWVVAVLTAMVAFSPPLLAMIGGGGHGVVPSGPLDAAVIHVQGIDCEACAAPIRKALAGAGGFGDMNLDLKSKSVSVSYEPGAGRPDAYVAAIDDLGYEARLVEVHAARPPTP